MKQIIFSLTIMMALFSCSKKDEAPTPSQPTAPTTKSLYVSSKSTTSGCTLTVVSSKAFTGASASDSGFVKQEIALHGQTASMVAYLSVGSSNKVYVKASSGGVYFTSIFDGVKDNNSVVKYNGVAYVKNF